MGFKSVKRRGLRWLALALSAAMALMSVSGCAPKEADPQAVYKSEVFTERMSALWSAVSEDEELKIPENGTTVFLSLCNRAERAKVVHASSASIEEAWKAAENIARKAVEKDGLLPMWVRADILTDSMAHPMSDIEGELGSVGGGSFRYGLSLDPGIGTAFLEAECNANGIYDYEANTVSAGAIEKYLGKKAEVPDEVTLFVTQGYFCGTDNLVRKLSGDETDFGTRRLEMTQDTAKAIVSLGASYLMGQQLEDGSFRYGYLAGSGDELAGYNSLRHWGTVWSLVEAYRLSPSEELAATIDAAINYGVTNYVVYRDDNTAFVRESGINAVNIGGGGLAAIAVSSYKEVFDTDRHDKLLSALGGGILAMSDPETGKFWHRWSDTFIPADEFISIYYEGEAAFALCKLYGVDQKAEYLDMAKRAADRFIEEDYAKYRDHWVAYTMDELTKYAPEERYYEFALRNIQSNMGEIRSKDASYHTVTELLMAGYDTYSRIVSTGAQVKYLEKFDEKAMFDAMDHRLALGLSAFGMPETVMYFASPMEMYGCFFVRRDNFRARIDDTQHFIGGYAQYAKADISANEKTDK